MSFGPDYENQVQEDEHQEGHDENLIVEFQFGHFVWRFGHLLFHCLFLRDFYIFSLLQGSH